MKLFKTRLDKLLQTIHNKAAALYKVFSITKKSQNDFIQSVEVLGTLIERHIEQGNLLTAKDNLAFLANAFLSLSKKETADNFSDSIAQFQNAELLAQKIDQINKGFNLQVPKTNTSNDLTSIQVFDYFLSITQRSWRRALDKKEFQFSAIVIYYHHLVLQRFSEQEKSLGKIRQLLYSKYRILSEALEVENSIERVNQVVLVGFDWYFNLVFSKDFRLEYLGEINLQLLYILRAIIDSAEENLLLKFIEGITHNDFISARVDNPRVPLNPTLSDKINKLKFKARLVFNESGLYAFNSDILNELNSESFRTISGPEKDALRASLCQTGEYYFKRWQLRFCMITIFAYLIKTENGKLVKEALELNQPPDARATWVNEEPIPIDADELEVLLLAKDRIGNIADIIWPGHHGPTSFIEMALFGCVANAIRLNPIKNYRELRQLEGSKESNLESLLYALKDLIDKYKALKPLFGEGKNTPNYAVDETSWNSIHELLFKSINIIEEKIKKQKREATVDSGLQESFITQLALRIKSEGKFRNIYSALNQLKFNDDKGPDSVFTLHQNHLIPKEPFISGANTIDIGSAGVIASEIGWWEDVKIIRTIIEKAATENFSVAAFHSILENLKVLEDFLLVCINIDPFGDLFFSSPDFKYLWQLQNNQQVENMFGEVGRYKEKLPVLSFYDRSNLKTILLLNKHSLGYLTFYKPSDKVTRIIGNIGLNIDFFSSNQNLKNHYLEENPKWLSLESNAAEYLDLHGLVSIEERFQVLDLKNDVGWFFKF